MNLRFEVANVYRLPFPEGFFDLGFDLVDLHLLGKPLDRLQNLGSPGHLLGTDEQGRDMLARVLYGGRLSLLAGFVPTLGAALIGTAIGVTAGIMRGAVGTVLMRAMDMLYAFPAILLAIAVGASLGPGLTNTIIAVTIVFIPPVARVAESATRRVVGCCFSIGGAVVCWASAGQARATTTTSDVSPTRTNRARRRELYTGGLLRRDRAAAHPTVPGLRAATPRD